MTGSLAHCFASRYSEVGLRSHSMVLLPSLSISLKNRWYFSRDPSSCRSCVGSSARSRRGAAGAASVTMSVMDRINY